MNKQDIIDEIMDYLNFEKIHKTMQILNWTWLIDEQFQIPSIPQIRRFLRKQLNTFLNENLKFISCGGFEIFKIEEDIHVVFAITDYNCEYDCEHNYKYNYEEF